MGNYKTKFGSKAWSIILLIIGLTFLIAGINYFNNIYRNNGLISIIVVFGISLFMLYKGISNWGDKIIISNGELIHKKPFHRDFINLKAIKQIKEVSGTHYYGRIDQKVGLKPLGTAYALIFVGGEGLLHIIKEIRSFVNYEKLYQELEDLTKIKIDREVKQWKNE